VIVLLEPVRPSGFVSGGYRYQDEIGKRLAAWGIGRQEALKAEQLAPRAEELRSRGDTVVVDGLFVGRAAAVPDCVLLLHMLPAAAWLRPWLQDCEGVIGTGEATARALRAARVPVTVVRPGLDACFTPGGDRAPDGKLRVLCVGTIASHKGQREVTAALVRDRELARRCVLECLGVLEEEPDYVASLRHEAGQGGLQLELPGVVTAAEVAENLRRTDLFVSASRSESFGMAVAEAVACAVPVLAFAAGEVGSFLRDGENGRLLPAGTPFPVFAGVLHRLLLDATERRRLCRPDLRPRLDGWDGVAREFAAAVERPRGSVPAP
jgi:glycosyltransferase involved in cell wall biosynthesis